MRRWCYYTLLLPAAALILAGCQGGAHSGALAKPSTRVSVTINWPARTRMIPAAANSVQVVLSDASGYQSSQALDRPTNGSPTTGTFTEVPIGTIYVTAEAYPEAGAVGVPQAAGFSTVVTQANVPAQVSLTMASTITALTLSPALTPLNVGDTRHLTATASDAAGNTVLLLPAGITWGTSDNTILQVDTYGNISGVGAGNAYITATESESGISTSQPIGVVVGPNGLPQPSALQTNVTALPTDGSIPVVAVTGTSVTLGGAAPSFQTGQVVVSDQPPYFMRVVTGTKRARDGTVVLTTSNAALEDVYHDLDLSISHTLSYDELGLGAATPSAGVSFKRGRVTRGSTTLPAVEITWSNAALTSGLTLSGDLTLETTLNLDCHIHGGTLQSMSCALVQEAQGTVTLTNTLASVSFSGSIPWVSLPECAYPDIDIFGPIFLQVKWGLDSEFDLEGDISQHVTYTGTLTKTTGFSFSNGALSAIDSLNKNFAPDIAVVPQVNGSATFYPVQASAAVLFEGLAGPELTAGVYFEATMQGQLSPPQVAFDFRCGYSVDISLDVDVPEFLKTLASFLTVKWEYTLASASVSLAGYPVTLTPGGGSSGGGGSGGGGSGTSSTTGGLNVSVGWGTSANGGVNLTVGWSNGTGTASNPPANSGGGVNVGVNGSNGTGTGSNPPANSGGGVNLGVNWSNGTGTGTNPPTGAGGGVNIPVQ